MRTFQERGESARTFARRHGSRRRRSAAGLPPCPHRRSRSSARRAAQGRAQVPSSEHARLKQRLNEANDSLVRNPVLEELHKPPVVDGVEESTNVGIEQPVHLLPRQPVARASSRSCCPRPGRKPYEEVRLVGRAQHLRDRLPGRACPPGRRRPLPCPGERVVDGASACSTSNGPARPRRRCLAHASPAPAPAARRGLGRCVSPHRRIAGGRRGRGARSRYWCRGGRGPPWRRRGARSDPCRRGAWAGRGAWSSRREDGRWGARRWWRGGSAWRERWHLSRCDGTQELIR